MTATKPIPETCHVYLDMHRLPDHPDGGLDPVPLSPFTITWGVNSPWDKTTPAVLKITLIDQDDRYSKDGGLLAGHRITVTPDWTADLPSPVNFCVFDGYITDVQVLDRGSGRNRLNITASDRIYLLKTDCRKGPNTNTDADTARGWQWWMQGTTNDTISQWLRYNGIDRWSLPWHNFAAPLPAGDRHSFMDWAESLHTRQDDNGTDLFEIDRLLFITYQSSTDATPALAYLYCFWTTDTVLTGPRIRSGDDGTDIIDDIAYPDAGNILVDEDPTLGTADEYYTQVELKYYHRGAASDGYKKYEFNQDGSRVAQVDTATRDGDTCLSVDVNWTQYDFQASSNPDKIDMSRAVAALHENNRRVRLPEVTFRSDRLGQTYMFCRPQLLTIIGSRFERRIPDTHGRWISIGGTLTYDVTGRRGHWTHKVRLFPVRDATTGTPTCGQLRDLASTAAFSDCNWKLGALRYVNTLGEET